MSRVIFAFGSRAYDDRSYAAQILNSIVKPGDELWSGGAGGADTIAEEWATARNMTVRSYRAEWTLPDGSFNRAAGTARTNAIIAALPEQTACIAFIHLKYPGPSGVRAQGGLQKMLFEAGAPGTAHTIGQLLAAGFRVCVVWKLGTTTNVVQDNGPRRPGWYPKTQSQRLDATDDSCEDLGDYGYSTRATQAWKEKETERLAKFNKHENENMGEDRRDIAGGSNRGAFGDAQRNSVQQLDVTHRFQPGQAAAICECCHESFQAFEDTERFCQVCVDRYAGAL